MLAPRVMGKASPIRNPIWCSYVVHILHMYTHESSTQDAPALRTRDGGLNIFHDRSTLPTHPVPQTLMFNDLHCIFYLHTLGSFEGWNLAKLWFS